MPEKPKLPDAVVTTFFETALHLAKATTRKDGIEFEILVRDPTKRDTSPPKLVANLRRELRRELGHAATASGLVTVNADDMDKTKVKVRYAYRENRDLNSDFNRMFRAFYEAHVPTGLGVHTEMEGPFNDLKALNAPEVDAELAVDLFRRSAPKEPGGGRSR
jgi:hypothetical protein